MNLLRCHTFCKGSCRSETDIEWTREKDQTVSGHDELVCEGMTLGGGGFFQHAGGLFPFCLFLSFASSVVGVSWSLCLVTLPHSC